MFSYVNCCGEREDANTRLLQVVWRFLTASLSVGEVDLIQGIRDKCSKFRKGRDDWYVGSSVFRHLML